MNKIIHKLVKIVLCPELIITKLKKILDKIRGLDFITTVNPEAVGLNPNESNRYSPSGDNYLNNVFTTLNISNQDAIIDVGCGKGSAMRTMLKHPFKRVDGVELSKYLANIAIKNFKILGINKYLVYISDAKYFNNYDNYNYIYFYNPFPCNVMVHVINHIVESIKIKKKKSSNNI